MSRKFKILFVSFLFLAGVIEAHSQNSNNFGTPKNAWLTIRSGISTFSDDSFYGGGISLSYSKRHYLISSRYLYFKRHQYEPLNADESQSNAQLDHNAEFAALFGYILNKRYFKFMASAGLGYTTWTSKNHQKDSGLSLPLEVGLFVSPLPILGFGIQFVSNLNQTHNLNGILISVELGKLW